MICSSCRALLRTVPRALPRAPITTLTTALRPSHAPSPLRPSAPTSLLSARRHYSSSPEGTISPAPPAMTEAESAIAALLSDRLRPTSVLVQDVSGGCGSMYAIDVASHAFRGRSVLQQQRLVNAALGDVIKGWHGVQIRTSVPPEE